MYSHCIGVLIIHHSGSSHCSEDHIYCRRSHCTIIFIVQIVYIVRCLYESTGQAGFMCNYGNGGISYHPSSTFKYSCYKVLRFHVKNIPLFSFYFFSFLITYLVSDLSNNQSVLALFPYIPIYSTEIETLIWCMPITRSMAANIFKQFPLVGDINSIIVSHNTLDSNCVQCHCNDQIVGDVTFARAILFWALFL